MAIKVKPWSLLWTQAYSDNESSVDPIYGKGRWALISLLEAGRMTYSE